MFYDDRDPRYRRLLEAMERNQPSFATTSQPHGFQGAMSSAQKGAVIQNAIANHQPAAPTGFNRQITTPDEVIFRGMVDHVDSDHIELTVIATPLPPEMRSPGLPVTDTALRGLGRGFGGHPAGNMVGSIAAPAPAAAAPAPQPTPAPAPATPAQQPAPAPAAAAPAPAPSGPVFDRKNLAEQFAHYNGDPSDFMTGFSPVPAQVPAAPPTQPPAPPQPVERMSARYRALEDGNPFLGMLMGPAQAASPAPAPARRTPNPIALHDRILEATGRRLDRDRAREDGNPFDLPGAPFVLAQRVSPRQINDLDFVLRMAVDEKPTRSNVQRARKILQEWKPTRTDLIDLKQKSEAFLRNAIDGQGQRPFEIAKAWNSYSRPEKAEVVKVLVDIMNITFGENFKVNFVDSPIVNGQGRGGWYTAQTNTITVNLNKDASPTFGGVIRTIIHEGGHGLLVNGTRGMDIHDVLRNVKNGTLSLTSGFAYANASKNLFITPEENLNKYFEQIQEAIPFSFDYFVSEGLTRRRIPTSSILPQNHPTIRNIKRHGL